MTAFRLGTRGSALAMAQAREVARRLEGVARRRVELVPVVSDGDIDRRPLAVIGGQGVFVTSLRQALVEGRVDAAVHSLKDLPTADPAGVALAAVPPRADPRDVVVARDGLTLAELPAGSVVGTGSPRRTAQLRALGLGLRVEPIRGNVDTRLRLVAERCLDAVVLARAGLARLSRLELVTEVLDPLQMLPAPGQGALAVECRVEDAASVEMVAAALDDPASRTAVRAERGLLAGLEAGCTAPVGALAEIALGEDREELWLRAVAASTDGARVVRMSITGEPERAAELGRELARQMLDAGADALVGERVP